MILQRLVGTKTDGFYVDIGAHHPRRFSNTCHFYLRGWRGINVDASADAIEALSSERPRDVNLCLGVGVEEGEFEFVQYDEPALSTFDKATAERRARESPQYSATRTSMMEVRRLDTILDRHMDRGETIDFLTVDTEGKDLEVLRSNDWARYRPRFVVVECEAVTLDDANEREVVKYLASLGYVGRGMTPNSLVFADGLEAGR